MPKPFYDLSDTELLAWSNNLSARLAATPGAFDVDPQRAAAYSSLNAAFDAGLTAWRDPVTRTPIASANKRAARAALVAEARYLVSSIDNNPATTPAQRDELGIRARKRPTPVPPPSSSPSIDVERVDGRVVTLRLHGDGPRRTKPPGVRGASVFTHVGPAAPADIDQWRFEGLVTRTRVDITFDATVGASTAWVTAFWYTDRGQSGVACAPVSVNLPAAPVVPAGAGRDAMKIAA